MQNAEPPTDNPEPFMHLPGYSFRLYALLTVLLWASAYVFTKVALRHYSSPALGFLRCAIACAVLIAGLRFRKQALPRLPDLPLFLLSGAAGFGLYLPVFNKGMETLNPSTSCILISTAPILSALLARLAFNERLSGLRWLGMAIAFGGVLVLSLWEGTLRISGGIVWTLGAALLISLYTIIQRSLARRYTALDITAWSFAAGTAMLCGFAPESLEQARSAPVSATALVFFLGIFPSALAYLCWSRALALAPGTSSVTNAMFLTPFLALLLEWVVTGTLPGPGTFLGGALILVGLLVFSRASGSSTR